MIDAQKIYMDLLRALGKDHPDKVIVARTVTRDNKTYTWHYWVNPDEVQPGDRVVANHHNLDDSNPQKYHIFRDEQEAYEMLGNNLPLPEEQEESVVNYTGNSDAMNLYLRKDELYGYVNKKYVEEDRKNIEEAISNFEIPKPLTVYRMVGAELLDKFIQAQEAGGIFKDAAFCSTSVIEGNFGDIKDIASLQMVIHVPAGKGIGAWLAPLSDFPEETELLLNHGTLFQIHKITPATKNRGPIVELTVIGRDPSHP